MKANQIKQIVSVSQLAIEKELNAVKISVKQLNKVNAEINRITGKATKLTEIIPLLSTGNFRALVTLNEQAFRDYYLECIAPGGRLNGVPMDGEALEAIIQQPDTSQLLQLVKGLPGGVIEYFSNGLITESPQGEILFADGAETAIRERYSIFAEEGQETARFEAAKKLADALNELCEFLPENPLYKSKIDLSGELYSVLSVDEETGRFIPADYFVKVGDVAEVSGMMTGSNNVVPEQKSELSDEYIRSLMN
jgi:hypothetical protein